MKLVIEFNEHESVYAEIDDRIAGDLKSGDATRLKVATSEISRALSLLLLCFNREKAQST